MATGQVRLQKQHQCVGLFFLMSDVWGLMAEMILFILLGAATVMACPDCKEMLAEPGQVQQRLAMARAFAVSIGVLLSVPFLLVSVVAWHIVRASGPVIPKVPGDVDTPSLSR